MNNCQPQPNADPQRMAEALTKAREISHELNQPIQVLMGMLELMLTDLEPGHPLSEDLQLMAGQCDRLGDMNRRLSRVVKLLD